MMNYKEIFGKSIMAGVAISIGCISFLMTGNVIGPILFTFGLLTVVHYKLNLYTGAVGFRQLFGTQFKEDWVFILLVIFGNIIGCLIVSILANFAVLPVSVPIGALISGRLNLPIIAVLVRAIGCGFIMTTAVKFAKEGKFLPLLFGVPLFIYSGFLHSIADTFYYLYGFEYINVGVALRLITTYIGNYFGCSAYKLFLT